MSKQRRSLAGFRNRLGADRRRVQRRRIPRRFQLALEALESRQLLAVDFGFGVNGSAPLPANEVEAIVGDLLTINVYLVESDDPAPDTCLQDNGVLSFDFIAEYEDTFGTVSQVTPSSAFAVFQLASVDELSSPATLRMAGTDPTFSLGVEPDPGTRYVELGTYEFQVTAVGTTDFTIVDPDPSPLNNGNALGDPSFAKLDGEIFTTDPAPMFRVMGVEDVVNLPGGTSFVEVEGDDVVFRDEAGDEIDRRPADTLETINIAGTADADDLLTIRGLGNDLPKLMFDGGAGGNDTVILEPRGSDVPLEYLRYESVSSLVTNVFANREPLGSSDHQLQVLNLESIKDQLQTQDREFVFADTDDAVTFDTGANADDEMLRIEGSNSEAVEFKPQSGSLNVSLGAGSDQFLMGLPVEQLPVLDGQDGTDELVLTGSGNHLDLTDANQNLPLNIEVIDIVGASPNELTINGQSVVDVTDTNNRLHVRHDDDDTVNYTGDDWEINAPDFTSGAQRHVLSSGDATVETSNLQFWQNPLVPFDVNFNNKTTSLDALLIINYLDRFDDVPVDLAEPTSADQFEFYYDVTGSRAASSLDALLIINQLAIVPTPPEKELLAAPPLVTQSVVLPDERPADPNPVLASNPDVVGIDWTVGESHPTTDDGMTEVRVEVANRDAAGKDAALLSLLDEDILESNVPEYV